MAEIIRNCGLRPNWAHSTTACSQPSRTDEAASVSWVRFVIRARRPDRLWRNTVRTTLHRPQEAKRNEAHLRERGFVNRTRTNLAHNNDITSNRAFASAAACCSQPNVSQSVIHFGTSGSRRAVNSSSVPPDGRCAASRAMVSTNSFSG